MQVKDIWQELKEATGLCDEDQLYRTLTRAVELLANEGLFDPLLGTVDFYVEGGHYVALPRDVKTPIRININSNPSFVRSRLYEYQPNTEGSQDEDEVGWMWHERGYSPIQDEKKLPSKLSYQVTLEEDEGKTLTFTGVDADGRFRKETLVGKRVNPEESENTIHEVRAVTREETEGEAWLLAEEGPIGRYYNDETHPEYRVIKLSKTGVAVRMLYRKHVFKIISQEDIIPLHSPMAVLRAADAVRLMMKGKYADAQQCLQEGIRFIGKEQDTRDEAQTLAVNLEITNTINRNISTNDVLIVADIYDIASEIIGPVGRAKLFDRLNDAILALQNKSKWDSTMGFCDIWRQSNCETVRRDRRACCDGYFVLPRYVKAVEALNYCGNPMIPRNKWFEFHLNGPGERGRSSCGTWDEVGSTVVINRLPKDTRTRRIIPVQVIAIPEDSRDEDIAIRIWGIERLADGKEVEVWRDGEKGWLCPCKASSYQLPSDAPAFVDFHRIKRETNSRGFIRLIGVPLLSTKIAMIADQGDDSADAREVTEMIKSMNPNEVIAAGDIDYRGTTSDIELGLVVEVDGPTLVIQHLKQIQTISPGDTFRVNGHNFTAGAINRQDSLDPTYDEILQITIDSPEDLADLGDLESDMIVTKRLSFEEATDVTLDRNIGKHWRKYIYPFAGDPNAAPLAEGEADATANHFWPVPGNHDWVEGIDEFSWRQDFDFDTISVPTTVLNGSLTGITWDPMEPGNIDLIVHFAPAGANWSVTLMQPAGNVIGLGTIAPAGGNIVFAGIGTFTFTAIANDPAVDILQIHINRRIVHETLQPYLDYFVLPGNERYYTKTFGEVQVFFLSSDAREPDGIAIGSPQHDWFVEQAAASTARWKVAVLHHTPRTSGTVHAADPVFKLWDFAGAGMNAVVAGHNHAYERWEEDGVLYLTVGTGNDDIYPFKTSGISSFSKKRLERHGALFMDASRKALRFSFRDKEGIELDTAILTVASADEEELLLGYWYPDELEPQYRVIKVPGCKSARIRIRYRKNTPKVSSLDDIINLRSRLAIECMLRSLATMSKDPMGAGAMEMKAIQYIAEEQAASNPIMAGGLQFDTATCPAVTHNIS